MAIKSQSPPGRNPKVKNAFCFKLDAMSVPEALTATILILLMFSIVLAHQGGSQSTGPPHPLGDAPWHPCTPLGIPSAHGGTGRRHVPNSATQTIIRLLFQFFPGVQNEFRIGGEGLNSAIATTISSKTCFASNSTA